MHAFWQSLSCHLVVKKSTHVTDQIVYSIKKSVIISRVKQQDNLVRAKPLCFSVNCTNFITFLRKTCTIIIILVFTWVPRKVQSSSSFISKISIAKTNFYLKSRDHSTSEFDFSKKGFRIHNAVHDSSGWGPSCSYWTEVTKFYSVLFSVLKIVELNEDSMFL